MKPGLAISYGIAFMLILIPAGSAQADRVDDLIKKLESKRSLDRREAAVELGKTNDPRAIEPLIALFYDKEPMTRLDASGALIELGRPVVKPLSEAIVHEEDEIFLWNAIRVLEEIADPEAIGALKKVQERVDDPQIQQIVRYALDRLRQSERNE